MTTAVFPMAVSASTLDAYEEADIILTAAWYVDEEDYLVINVTWTGYPSEDGVNVSYYEVHKQGGPYISLTAYVAGNITTIMDYDVLPYAHYRYYVVAVMEDDSKSGPSNVEMSTPGVEDQAPTYLIPVCGTDFVMLTWMPPKSFINDEVTAYIVYRGESLEDLSPIAIVDGHDLEFNDTDAPAGDLYYLIASVDGADEEYWGVASRVVLLGEAEGNDEDPSMLGVVLLITGGIAAAVVIVLLWHTNKKTGGGRTDFDRFAVLVLMALVVSAMLSIGSAMTVLSIAQDSEGREDSIFQPGDYVEFAFYSYGMEYSTRIEVISIGDTSITINETTIYPGVPPIYQIVSSPKNMTIGAGFNLNDLPPGYTIESINTEMIWTIWGLRETEHYTIRIEAAPEQYIYFDMWMREELPLEIWVTINTDTTALATVIDCNIPAIIYP